MTIYALISDGSISRYPYTVDNLREDHPNTSFPLEASDLLLAEFNVLEVLPSERPVPTLGAAVEEGEPSLIDGSWQQTWVSRALTAEEIKATVPYSVTPLQIRKALRESGIKALVDQYVGTLPEEVVEEWEYATEVLRDNPTLLTAAAALGMTEEQADDLFRLAATK